MMKNTVFILMTSVYFFMSKYNSIAQDSTAFKKNEFGLTIISSISIYNKSVAEDSNKRMTDLRCDIFPFIADWKYATKNNFTHEILYKDPVAFVRLPVALALQKVQQELKKRNLGLKFYDAYRPYGVTKKMWSIVHDERFAANPKTGSGHNRGIAVDVSLINLKDSIEMPMPTAFDDFTEKASNNYMQLDTDIINNRNLLKNIMEQYGFTNLSSEWWHFYFSNADNYELLDIDFHLLHKISACF